MLEKFSSVNNNSLLRVRRLSTEYSDEYVSDYENIWEEFIENKEEQSESVLLLCVFIIILSIIFLSSITTNVSILLVFARKQSLRTTSNRWAFSFIKKKLGSWFSKMVFFFFILVLPCFLICWFTIQKKQDTMCTKRRKSMQSKDVFGTFWTFCFILKILWLF